MQASAGVNLTCMDKAKTAALAILANLPTHSTVRIILAGGKADVLGPRNPGHLDQARSLIEGVAATEQGSDLTAALAEAEAYLLGSASPNKELYIFSDLQKNGWERQAAALKEKAKEIQKRATLILVRCGNPERPVNAVPPRAKAHCQIRFTVDKDPLTFLPALRRHLDAHGFQAVKVSGPSHEIMKATRLDPDHAAAQWAAASMTRTMGVKPAVLPNAGGSLPNDVFTEVVGVPTIWVPHSYASCSQHAPNEHVLDHIMREGLQIMTGMFWDMGEAPPKFN